VNPILIDWIWEGLLVILLAYFSAIGLRSGIASILKKEVPVQLGILAACAIYTAVTWAFYYNYTTPLSTVFPWLGFVVLGGIGLNFFTFVQGKKSILTMNTIVVFIKPLVEFVILFLIFIVLYSLLVADRRLPMVISGNNDIWSYAKFTHLALDQPMGNNIVNLNLLKIGAADQSPTAFMYLTGLAYCSGREIVDILGVGLILILTACVFIVKEICVKQWYMRASLAYLIGVAWIASPFSFYLTINYFLAQWLGICLFLATVLMVLAKAETILIQTAILSLLNYLMFMTYPALFFPYMGILLFLVAIESAFSWKYLGTKFINSGLVSFIFSIPASLGIVCALDLSHFKIMLLRIIELSSGNGWPLRLLNPLALMAFPVTPIDLGIGIYKKVGYFIILVLIGYLTYRAHQKKTLSSVRFAVSTVFITGLLMYLCYYALKGASYQQWKLAGSVILPLSFVPVAAVISVFDGKGRMSATAKYALLIVLISLNVFFMIKYATRSLLDLRMYAPLRELTHFDRTSNVKVINVDFKNDFTGTMIATQFINQAPLSFWSRSYFSEDKAGDYSKLSGDNILVTNNCAVNDFQNLTMLGESFCIINEVPRLAEHFSIQFNKPLPPILRTVGLSGQEWWGRWSEGHEVSLDIPVDMKWKGVELKIKGSPFIPQGIKSQRMSFSVHGNKVKELSISSESEIIILLKREMFDDGSVKLIIDLPDAVPPSQFGSADTRVLGFWFHTLEVKARNEGGHL